VFTGDTIFSECTTWLMTSNVDQWIEALDRLRALEVEHVIPGHGPVQPSSYLARQRAFLLEWKSAVAVAVANGWTREETIARVNFAERYPVDIGQEYMMDYIQERNAGALWDKLTAPTETTYPAKEPPKR
jgi:cyclase